MSGVPNFSVINIENLDLGLGELLTGSLGGGAGSDDAPV